MKAIWGTSLGFPGPLPVEPFKQYIRRNEYVANHYWSAYPGHTTTEIISAGEVAAALPASRRRRPASARTAFKAAYEAFPDEGPGQPVNGRHDICGQAHSLTVLTAIRAGRESALARYLNALESGPSSPLSRVATDALRSLGRRRRRRLRGEGRARPPQARAAPLHEQLRRRRTSTRTSSRCGPASARRRRDLGPLQRATRAARTRRRSRRTCAGTTSRARCSSPRTATRTVEDVKSSLAARAAMIAFAMSSQGLAPADLQVGVRAELLRDDRPRPPADPGLRRPRRTTFPVAGYLFLQIGDKPRIGDKPGDVDLAAAWISAITEHVQTAATWTDQPASSVNVAFSYAGLRKLDLPDACLAGFPEEFRQGMAARAEMLGDTGQSARRTGRAASGSDDIHVLVMISATALRVARGPRRRGCGHRSPRMAASA